MREFHSTRRAGRSVPAPAAERSSRAWASSSKSRPAGGNAVGFADFGGAGWLKKRRKKSSCLNDRISSVPEFGLAVAHSLRINSGSHGMSIFYPADARQSETGEHFDAKFCELSYTSR